METTVEAGSLASILALAADPPIDPRSRLRDERNELVLYIARVPGSRDVFLSPMKPRAKVVTAEDVESSLYYLHVHNSHDHLLVQGPSTGGDQRQETAPIPPPHRILPDGILLENHNPYSHSVPSFDGRTVSRPLPPIPHMEVAQSAVPNRDGNPYGSWQELPRRKPVDQVVHPLASRSQFASAFNADVGVYGERHHPLVPPYPEQEVPPDMTDWLPNRKENDRSGLHQSRLGHDQRDQPDASLNNHNGQSDSSDQNSSYIRGAMLTLIRRNPSTGEQWNVARIGDPTVIGNSPSGRRFSRATGLPIHIAIGTPGYAKFQSKHPIGFAATHGPSARSNEILESNVFQRELVVEESRFSLHKKSKSSNNVGVTEFLRPQSVNGRSSSDFGLPGDSSHSSLALPIVEGEYHPNNSKTKGYSFDCPWNGRCEFSAAVGSSSLKCKHRMGPSYFAPGTSLPTVVSELRFNLPGGGPLAKPLSPKTASNPYASSLDLSLGQELAGGGFAGKQAKLGKLILQRDGLKMLDLLVAANLSLWFRAYEKGQGQYQS